MLIDRSDYLARLGNPSTWTGDWRRPGNYLVKERQRVVHARLREGEPTMLGMAIRGHGSQVIAAVFCVSRESIDSRLRPHGLKNAPGQVGRPARRVA